VLVSFCVLFIMMCVKGLVSWLGFVFSKVDLFMSRCCMFVWCSIIIMFLSLFLIMWLMIFVFFYVRLRQ